MAETATYIVLTAGTMTFANEWYQTGQVNWRIPVATFFAAAIMDGMSKVSNEGAIALSIMVLIGAATAQFGGKSVSDTVASLFTQATTQPKKTVTPVKKVA